MTLHRQKGRQAHRCLFGTWQTATVVFVICAGCIGSAIAGSEPNFTSDDRANVAAAVERFLTVYETNGMAGANGAVQSCYGKMPPQAIRRLDATFFCIALDTAAFSFDQTASSSQGWPVTEGFTPKDYAARTKAVLDEVGLTDPRAQSELLTSVRAEVDAAFERRMRREGQ